jgi:LDH2 family malate/lactate/ureidoglycolate dehydrogenase
MRIMTAQTTGHANGSPQPRYSAADLLSFATALFHAAGLPPDRAAIVAEVLVEGDLMGHTTHGLQLASRHLDAIKTGVVVSKGDPQTLADSGATLTWDGCWLPGTWLVRMAMAAAFDRIVRHPVTTVVIRRCGHIGCLAAYPRLAAEKNLMLLLMSSDPAVRNVAPYGAVEGRYTPNPIAAGWPTDGDPVIVDTCPSTTTAGMVGRLSRAGERFPGPWLIDGSGQPSDDPAVAGGTGHGAIMPLGGIDLGHKGFALGLMVEALTSALAGFGRADGVDQDGASVFLQIINPDAFAGIDAFRRETTWLAQSCQTAAPRPGQAPVRMPGARGLALRKTQLRDGVALHPETFPALEVWAARLGVKSPSPIVG